MDAYLNRKDIISRLEKELTCDTLVVVGSKSAHVSAAETMYSKMDKVRFIDCCLQPINLYDDSVDIWN